MNSSCTRPVLTVFWRRCMRGSRGWRWGPVGSRAEGLAGRRALECVCGRQLRFTCCVLSMLVEKTMEAKVEMFVFFFTEMWWRRGRLRGGCEELKILLHFSKQTLQSSGGAQLSLLQLIWEEKHTPAPAKPHAWGSYLGSASQNIFSCGLMCSVASLSGTDGNLMSHLFTLCAVVLDPGGFNMLHIHILYTALIITGVWYCLDPWFNPNVVFEVPETSGLFNSS